MRSGILHQCRTFRAWANRLWGRCFVHDRQFAPPSRVRLGLELLEMRAVPAIVNPLSIGGVTQATYTDSNGDIVTVRIAGTAGSANFFDAGGLQVDDGDDIASVGITGASSDFTLTYSVNAAGGDGVVAMGDIMSNRTIRGIYSVPDSGFASVFNLGSFSGVSFSTGGGLSVDNIVGDTADVGLNLTGGLKADTVINIRGDLDADLFLGNNSKDKNDGAIFIGNQALVGSNIAFTGKVGPSFSLVVQSTFNATLQSAHKFNGSVNIDSDVDTPWDFNGGVGSKALLLSDDWFDVNVIGNFAGLISSESSDVDLDVTGDVTGTARIQSSDAITLSVSGSVLQGATATGDSGITFDIDRKMSGSFLAGSSELTGTVGGSVKGATLVSSNDATVTVSGGVTNSTIAADGDLDLDVTGTIDNSDISSGHSEVSLNVGGSVTNSRFSGALTGTIAGNVSQSRFRASGFNDLTLTIGGNLRSTRIEIDEEISVAVTGKVTDSKLISSSIGGVTLDVGTDLLNSRLVAADDDIQLNVGRDALNNTFATDDTQQTFTIGRDFQGLFTTGSGDLTLTVGGSVLAGSQFLQGDNLEFDITGNFDGVVLADRLNFEVGGNVGAGTRLNVHSIGDGGDANSIGFAVGGNFAGILNVVDFDPNSDVTAGENHVLVAGKVTKKARFNIQDIASTSADDTYTFGGNFSGQLNIGGDLDVDLNFTGNAKRVTIGGAVEDTITVGGKLTYLAAGGSLFNVTTPGFDGDFEDGNGNVTGNLDTTGGFVTVIPTV